MWYNGKVTAQEAPRGTGFPAAAGGEYRNGKPGKAPGHKAGGDESGRARPVGPAATDTLSFQYPVEKT